ncbi:MAG: hypothetical protein AB7H90_01415 [Alphaproteobacteria bacterium]
MKSETSDDKTEARREADQKSPSHIVDQWWQDFFPGSEVARNTEAWNMAFAAKEDLKRRLERAWNGGR